MRRYRVRRIGEGLLLGQESCSRIAVGQQGVEEIDAVLIMALADLANLAFH